MNLTPEEKFNQDVLYVLAQIKEKSLYTLKGKPIEYWVNYNLIKGGEKYPTTENEARILEKLQEWKIIRIINKEVSPSDFYVEAEVFYLDILQPNFDNFCKKLEEIDENPWFSNDGRVIRRKKLLKRRQKKSKENEINFPTHPEVIEEYLNILNRIEQERQRTPDGEPIAFPVPKGALYAKGVPLPEQETSILRIFEQNGIIEITEKTIPIIDEFDPYENSETIRAVKIPDLDKFKNYRDKLSNLKNQLGKSYKERKTDAEARAKEMRRQFEELDEKQKAFEELGRQISSRIQKDFDVKQYGEVIKKIDEQAEPIRRALKQLDAVYSGSVQNSLTPVLQRLTESIKPIGEQMKRLKPLFEYPEYPKEAFISSDVIRARQGAETISKLENIEALLQGLLSKDKEKPKQVKIIKPEESKEIKKITIIEMNNGKYLFAVNDNYKETKKILDSSEWWQIFIKEIAERNMRPETRTNVKEISKDMTDYFNYNTNKCPIYMGGKYDLINIFVGKDIDTTINPDIKTEIISEKKYLIRKKKKGKK